MNIGWIKLHRQFTEWEWYSDINTKTLFIHLLLTANFEESKFRGEDIKRGEVVVSLDKLASTLSLSIQQLRTAILKLKKTGEINTRSNKHYTVVTVCKYDDYQKRDDLSNTQSNNQITIKQQSNNNQITMSKEEEEEKEEKEEYLFEKFWDVYDKKQDRVKCEKKWKSLATKDKNLILYHIPKYVSSTPDKKYRKNPLTYLNSKTWLDDELPNNANNSLATMNGYNDATQKRIETELEQSRKTVESILADDNNPTFVRIDDLTIERKDKKLFKFKKENNE